MTLTIEECVQICAEWNNDHGGSSMCRGVTWNGDLTGSGAQGGNCFQKYGSLKLNYCGKDCLIAATAELLMG